MNELEATRAKLKCLEMVEGTDLDWWDVVRYKINKESLKFHLCDNCIDELEFALGIVEGKPVWAGDTLYYKGVQNVINHNPRLKLPDWSWNPPKPKTVMVELLVEDAELFAIGHCVRSKNVTTAFRKALEEMK